MREERDGERRGMERGEGWREEREIEERRGEGLREERDGERRGRLREERD